MTRALLGTMKVVKCNDQSAVSWKIPGSSFTSVANWLAGIKSRHHFLCSSVTLLQYGDSRIEISHLQGCYEGYQKNNVDALNKAYFYFFLSCLFFLPTYLAWQIMVDCCFENKACIVSRQQQWMTFIHSVNRVKIGVQEGRNTQICFKAVCVALRNGFGCNRL